MPLFLSLDCLDKSEATPLPEGYSISIAYACLLDVVRSVCLAVEGVPESHLSEEPSNGQTMEEEVSVSDVDDDLKKQLVESTWCGALAALCLLLESR